MVYKEWKIGLLFVTKETYVLDSDTDSCRMSIVEGDISLSLLFSRTQDSSLQHLTLPHTFLSYPAAHAWAMRVCSLAVVTGKQR